MNKVLLFLYSLFLGLFTIFSYAFVDQNLFYLKNIFTGFAYYNRLPTTIFYISFIIIFFVFYGVFINLCVRKRLFLKDIYLLLGITAAGLFLSYPTMLSYDIFNYMATSKVLFFYHENPYIIMPIEFIGEPLLAFTRAANKIVLYGPSWVALTAIPYYFGFGNFILTLLGFKFFILAFYFLTVFLIWKMSRNIIVLILFSLNPLIIIETLISGHNDIVMIFFVIFSFFLLQKKKIFLATIFFILSVLIKYATVLLFLILLYIIWKLIKNKEVDWQRIYCSSAMLMFLGFVASPIREEIYPWYAIWFLPFVYLVYKNKVMIYLSTALSFGLLLRYTPYLITGTYAGATPLLRELITFTPSILVLLYYGFKKKV